MAAKNAEQGTQRERAVWRIGLLASVLVHLIALVIFQTRPERLTPYAAAGTRSGDPVAAPAGGGMRAVVLRPPIEIIIPPRPEVPLIKPVEIQPLEEPVLALSELRIPHLGEGDRRGPESGPGLPGGEGRGDGGNAMTGLRRLIPPTPRHAIMTPMGYRPTSVRGRDVTVWVFVTEAGAVDSVRLDPPTPDKRFNELLKREARDWLFEPAERAGRAVPTWTSYSWKL